MINQVQPASKGSRTALNTSNTSRFRLARAGTPRHGSRNRFGRLTAALSDNRRVTDSSLLLALGRRFRYFPCDELRRHRIVVAAGEREIGIVRAVVAYDPRHQEITAADSSSLAPPFATTSLYTGAVLTSLCNVNLKRSARRRRSVVVCSNTSQTSLADQRTYLTRINSSGPSRRVTRNSLRR